MRIGINQFCFPAPCDVSEALHRAKGLGYDCMEICLTADRKPGPAVGSVTDALDISGYFNRLLHEHAGEAEFLQLRRKRPWMQSGGCWTQLRCWERPLLW